MEELKKEVEKALESLKDFSKFVHLFSEDKAEAELAELRSTLQKINTRILLSEIKEIGFPKNKAIKKGFSGNHGDLVRVKPCAEKYGGKTYLGFLIGDVALGSSIGIEENKLVCSFSGHNPGILVPELNEIIYGCESWWGQIKSEEDLKEITDEDIGNTWYVKLLREMSKKERQNK
jgi:hypothetical protein